MNLIKVSLVGDSNVGKTTALQTYKNKSYTPSETATLGIMNNVINIKDEQLSLYVSISFLY